MPGLFVDIGNTRLKWRSSRAGVGYTPGDAQGSMATSAICLTDLVAAWGRLDFSSVWIANVAAAPRLEVVLDALRSCRPQSTISVVTSQAHAAGVINCYVEPGRLGADRWAALIGARALYPQQAVLIASLGTATTIDLLGSDGRYRGGVIFPGAAMMRRALATDTAQLPLSRGLGALLACDTENAIESGILHAQAGALERILRLIEAEATGDGRPVCLLSGGNAQTLGPLLPFSTVIVDNLVLRGLLELARDAGPPRIQE
jgi:type III pantothenate kinase